MKLQQKVYLSLVTAILFPLTLSTFLFSSSITSFLTDKLETSELPTALAEVRNAIELELSSPVEASKAIATNTMVTNWITNGESSSKLAEFTEYLANIKANNEAISAFIVSGETSNYYTNDGIIRQINQNEDKWFYKFTNSGKEFELSLDVDKNLGQAAVFINYSIKVNNKVVALAGVGRSLEAMTKLIKGYRIADTGIVYLVDSEGIITLHPNHNLIGRKIDLAATRTTSLNEVDINGEEHIRSSIKLKSIDWNLVAEIPKVELFGAIQSAIFQNIFVGLLIAALGFVLTKILANQIFSPIRWIHKSVVNLTEKDGDLTARIRVDEQNEVGELAQQINIFLEQLHGMFKRVSNATEHVKIIADTVADKVNHSKHLADTQSNSTQTVAAAVNEMESTVRQISENAAVASGVAHDTELKTNAGNEFVQLTIDQMKSLELSMNHSVDSVNELSNEIQSITHVLDVIKGISEQTNLLALNAAIEAARAGEQGRGFAVVADEVRTLAKRTADSTEEINSMIAKLQNKASDAVSAIKIGSEGTQNAAGRLIKTGETFTEVAQEIVKLTEMNNQVALSTKEQTLATGEINENVVLISDTAGDNKQKMEEAAELCLELETNAKELEHLVSKFVL
ncbi:methyl-accepting chemotaxis protein [Psychrosphaera sp. B3R10]|uniref:methyl-accepting chemotaxis protein n=1 Tax=unclassified Psychrosphaera TaxID=2641570 RepID=UPI001C09F48E|nr:MULTISPECIES: methyl-accepting chemotaxis protein [unclassified Psychrosphaera]MBU2880842.1 methyl-accepting chemotaxis protein [Psychrosphaera sp. I2R16]MBU2990939.1 methyl-accepting chemotaxis protein [Psychrosphaera sp. B3R10]